MIPVDRKEIESTGAKVIEDDSYQMYPPRLVVELPAPSFECRSKLAELGYEIGQEIHEQSLKFFVTKKEDDNERN